jgi:hypothetical protein
MNLDIEMNSELLRAARDMLEKDNKNEARKLEVKRLVQEVYIPMNPRKADQKDKHVDMDASRPDVNAAKPGRLEADFARVKDKTAAQKHIRQGNAALDVGDVHAGITEFQSAMLILHRLNEQCPRN